MVRKAHTTGSRLLRMLASHNASSDCMRSPSCREEGGRAKSSDQGTLESKTIGNQLSAFSMHIPVECRPPPNIDITKSLYSWRRGRERCQAWDVVRQTLVAPS